MTVWVVVEHFERSEGWDFHGTRLCGVFSSQEKADAFIGDRPRDEAHAGDYCAEHGYFEILRRELDS